MDSFYLPLIKKKKSNGCVWTCPFVPFLCHYEFQGGSVTFSHVSHTFFFTNWLFLSGWNSFCPLINCSTFSNRSLPADVWRVKVMTSPHDYYRAKQSFPHPKPLLCILSSLPTGFHTRFWSFPRGTLLPSSALTWVRGLRLRKVRAPTRHRFRERSVSGPNPSQCPVGKWAKGKHSGLV